MVRTNHCPTGRVHVGGRQPLARSEFGLWFDATVERESDPFARLTVSWGWGMGVVEPHPSVALKATCPLTRPPTRNLDSLRNAPPVFVPARDARRSDDCRSDGDELTNRFYFVWESPLHTTRLPLPPSAIGKNASPTHRAKEGGSIGYCRQQRWKSTRTRRLLLSVVVHFWHPDSNSRRFLVQLGRRVRERAKNIFSAAEKSLPTQPSLARCDRNIVTGEVLFFDLKLS